MTDGPRIYIRRRADGRYAEYVPAVDTVRWLAPFRRYASTWQREQIPAVLAELGTTLDNVIVEDVATTTNREERI